MHATKVGHTVLALVGCTPMVQLNRVGSEHGARIWAKLEFFNPAGSVKDRTALAMVATAKKTAISNPG